MGLDLGRPRSGLGQRVVDQRDRTWPGFCADGEQDAQAGCAKRAAWTKAVVLLPRRRCWNTSRHDPSTMQPKRWSPRPVSAPRAHARPDRRGRPAKQVPTASVRGGIADLQTGSRGPSRLASSQSHEPVVRETQGEVSVCRHRPEVQENADSYGRDRASLTPIAVGETAESADSACPGSSMTSPPTVRRSEQTARHRRHGWSPGFKDDDPQKPVRWQTGRFRGGVKSRRGAR